MVWITNKYECCNRSESEIITIDDYLIRFDDGNDLMVDVDRACPFCKTFVDVESKVLLSIPLQLRLEAKRKSSEIDYISEVIWS